MSVCVSVCECPCICMYKHVYARECASVRITLRCAVCGSAGIEGTAVAGTWPPAPPANPPSSPAPSPNVLALFALSAKRKTGGAHVCSCMY
jgi:hypothetical protein